MRIKYHFIFFLIIFAILSSCTVEKRLHKRGYYVEWRTKMSDFHNKPKVDVIQNGAINEIASSPKESIIQLNENVAIIEESESLNVTKIKEDEAKKIVTENIKNFSNEKKLPLVDDSKHKLIIQKSENNHSKLLNNIKSGEMHKLATIGFTMALLSIFLLFTALPAMYICALALKQIDQNPIKYKNRYMALIGYIFSVIFVTLMFVYIAVILSLLISFSIKTIITVGSIYLFFIVSSLIVINS